MNHFPDQRRDLAAAIASVAFDHLRTEPAVDSPVIRLRSPGELSTLFEACGVPLDLADGLDAADPEALVAAARLIVDYSVNTSHRRFWNQNFAGPDPVAVAGDWLGATLNTTGATFEAAPVFTLMEAALLRKLARVTGYPQASDGVPPGLFAPGGSSGTLYALQLARHRMFPEVTTAGSSGEPVAVFVSDAGHYSAKKSASLLGLGTDAVVAVDSDADGALVPAALDRAIDRARDEGRRPMAVVGTAGTTVTSAFDPLDAIADRCAEHRIWFHVDGCYGGSALFSARHRHLLAGVERSDSFIWNLHKMMGITQQCSALLVRDPAQLSPCFATGANYLFQPDKLNGHLDSGDRHFQCARRIDSAKLWLTWHASGDHGFAARVDHAVELADFARRRIAERDEFAVVVAGAFTNVVFLWIPPELRPFDGLGDEGRPDPGMHRRLHDLAPRIKARMQADGVAMLGYQPTHGINTFRFLFMNPAVEPSDVAEVLDYIDRVATEEWTT